jgi:hypothetical protein
VGENFLPAYYLLPDAAHPAKPTDPCSTSELFVSLIGGLTTMATSLSSSIRLPARRHDPLEQHRLAVLGLLLGFGVWRLRPSKRTHR